ncbi:high frequency lysogenization protein HflD [Gallaecimonas sp. GXIMD4217]|uniref:high frequency lysogenization protein HflD n=1 Tax=Gallaecimonas sp. GXIMD4217 TaxID=3131927 RepID=UPI00311AE57D
MNGYRTQAFAAICQAVTLVQQIARQGQCAQQALKALLGGILVTDPQSPAEVYGDNGLRLGHQMLIELMSNANGNRDPELTRYLVGLLTLERRLAKRKDVLSLLSERINQVKRQVSHYGLEDDKVLANLADIYSELISPLGPKVQVAGSPMYLQQSLNQHQVRAALLGGIRAAVLWRQLGGRRLQLLFSRSAMVNEAKAYLA